MVKSVLATLVLASTSVGVALNLDRLVLVDSEVDQSRRMLIIFGTEGGDRLYDLTVKNYVRTDGSVEVVFFASAEDVTYGDKANGFDLDISVSFVGEQLDGVRCGENSEGLASIDVSSLPEGPQNAVRLDALGGSASATNFRGAPGTDDSDNLHEIPARRFDAELGLLDDEYNYSGRVQGEGDRMWAETCLLPKRAVWRSGRSDFFGTQRTLLLPQINWTSNGTETNYQNQLTVLDLVARDSETTLVESYPPLAAYSSTWEASVDTFWAGEQGEPSNVGYSDSGVHVFDERGRPEKIALYLTLAGALLGVAGTLAVFICSRVIDAAVWLFSSNRGSRTSG